MPFFDFARFVLVVVPILKDVATACTHTSISDPGVLADILKNACRGKADPKAIFKLIVVLASGSSGGFMAYSGVSLVFAGIATGNPLALLLVTLATTFSAVLGNVLAAEGGAAFVEEVYRRLENESDSDVTVEFDEESVPDSLPEMLDEIADDSEEGADFNSEEYGEQKPGNAIINIFKRFSKSSDSK